MPQRIAFVLGAPRSGTTLLRVMLAGHPQLFSPPEMVLAPFETMAQRRTQLEQRYWEKGGLRRALMDLTGGGVEEARSAAADFETLTVPEAYERLFELVGERMLVDKCPHLCARPDALRRLDAWFPDARWLLILRNPASVLRSIENMPMAEVILQGYADDPRRIWYEAYRVLDEFLDEIPEHRKAALRYEDLVTEPETTMAKACAALGVPFDEATIWPYEGDRMREGPKGARAIGDPNLAGRGRIQPELATAWLASFDHRRVDADTKALALRLGYDLEAIPLPPVTRVDQALASLWAAARELAEGMHMPAELDAVEGRRFLLRILAQSLETFTEYHDPDRPEFLHAEGPHRKMFADCPDTDYLRAPLRLGPGSDGRPRVYRLRGHLPTGSTYLGILLYGRGGRIGSRLSDRDLGVDADGNFELRISTEPQPGPWLRGAGDETAVIVRQYFVDRDAEAAVEPSLRLDLVGEPGPPPPLDPTELARGVARAERSLRVILDRTRQALQMARGMALKRFVTLDGEQFFPTPDNAYQLCWYRIGYNQLMLVRGRLPSARYFSMTLYNAWMESLDYRHRQVHLNHGHIRCEDDGHFEICIAHRDLGHPNWLDTAGHQAGYLLARSLLPEGAAPDFEVQTLYEEEYEAGATALNLPSGRG
jgi:hypothetical protein